MDIMDNIFNEELGKVFTGDLGERVAKEHEMEIRKKMRAINQQIEEKENRLKYSLTADELYKESIKIAKKYPSYNEQFDAHEILQAQKTQPEETVDVQNKSDSPEILQKEIYAGSIFQESQNEDKLNPELDNIFLTRGEQRIVQGLAKLTKELSNISKELHELNKCQKETVNELKRLRGVR